MSERNTTTAQPALCDFADRWKLDGDYLRCRRCRRPQIISCAQLDFPHASGCKGAAWERHPWQTLASLINAHIPNTAAEGIGLKAQSPAGSSTKSAPEELTQRPCAHDWCEVRGAEPNGKNCIIGFDEFLAAGVDVHIERMGDGGYWMSLTKGDQVQRVEFWILRGKLRSGTERHDG